MSDMKPYSLCNLVYLDIEGLDLTCPKFQIIPRKVQVVDTSMGMYRIEKLDLSTSIKYLGYPKIVKNLEHKHYAKGVLGN